MHSTDTRPTNPPIQTVLLAISMPHNPDRSLNVKSNFPLVPLISYENSILIVLIIVCKYSHTLYTQRSPHIINQNNIYFKYYLAGFPCFLALWTRIPTRAFFPAGTRMAFTASITSTSTTTTTIGWYFVYWYWRMKFSSFHKSGLFVIWNLYSYL